MNITKWLATTLFSSTLIITSAYAQQEPGRGSVTVFSEAGENFTLYLNGDQKNASPAKRVVADNITEVPVSFRIVFENAATPVLTKKGLRGGTHCLYSIVKNKKGEHVLKINDCKDEPAQQVVEPVAPASQLVVSESVNPAPAQLTASYANGIITINDGRTLTVKKVKASGMTYPRVIMTALTGAQASISYDNNDETYAAEIPFSYEVKDYSNNNAYLTLTVNEGSAARTWHVKLQNANGYDLKIE